MNKGKEREIRKRLHFARGGQDEKLEQWQQKRNREIENSETFWVREIGKCQRRGENDLRQSQPERSREMRMS